MKRQKKSEKQNSYRINRNLYESIKKFDHRLMEDFLGDIYKSGYKDGQEDIAKERKLDDVKDALKGIKGIGPKTWALIEEKLDALFQEGKKNEQ